MNNFLGKVVLQESARGEHTLEISGIIFINNYLESIFINNYLKVNETLNVTQFQDEISEYIKNCQQLKQRSWIPLLVPSKPPVNWEGQMVLSLIAQPSFRETKIQIMLLRAVRRGHILHSTILRGDVWGTTLPGILYTLQLNPFA